MGCGRRVTSGLDRVFSIVDRAIVLEDDCVASPDFFLFCDSLLKRYEDNEQVWTINGNSYNSGQRFGDSSYYFSKFPDTWGWATWRRAWSHFQADMPFLDAWSRSDSWRNAFESSTEEAFFYYAFRRARSGVTNAWGYQWLGCQLHGMGLSATPNGNLVKNIGFGPDGTHTIDAMHRLQYDVTPLGTLTHPPIVRANPLADAHAGRRDTSVRSLRGLVRQWLGYLFLLLR
jgi:hypothetical protein